MKRLAFGQLNVTVDQTDDELCRPIGGMVYKRSSNVWRAERESVSVVSLVIAFNNDCKHAYTVTYKSIMQQQLIR